MASPCLDNEVERKEETEKKKEEICSSLILNGFSQEDETFINTSKQDNTVM